MEEHSEYQYPVVLDHQDSRQAASFLNIEDMLFEVNIVIGQNNVYLYILLRFFGVKMKTI